MASSAPPVKSRSLSEEAAVRKFSTKAPESDGRVLSLVQRNRVLFLTSPFWFSAIIIALRTFGGSELRAAINFLSGI